MADYILINGELYHHGIKGMKWGVRRYQNEDGSLTNAGKKRYNDGDIVIKKGKKFQRISDNPENETDKNRKHAYVSYKRSDNKKYSKDFVKGMIRSEGPKDVYKITYRAKNDIVSPSKAKRMQAFDSMMGDKKTSDKVYSEIAKTLKNDFQGGTSVYSKMSDKKIVDELKQYKTSDPSLYKAFSFSILSSKYNRDRYFDLLGKQGYNAIVDDMDSGGYSKRAIIVFDRYKDMSYSDCKRIVKGK